MTRRFSIHPRKLFPGIILLSLGIHCAVFYNISIAFPDRTDKSRPVLSFLGSILSEQDFYLGPRDPSNEPFAQGLPQDFLHGIQKQESNTRLLKPNYSPRQGTENKTDFKPELNPVNPREEIQKESTDNLFGIDLKTPPRPTLKLNKP